MVVGSSFVASGSGSGIAVSGVGTGSGSRVAVSGSGTGSGSRVSVSGSFESMAVELSGVMISIWF